MRRLAAQIWDALRHRHPNRRAPQPGRRRLEVEALEVRAVPTANVAPALTGLAFVDRAGTGVFAAGDVPLAGLTVVLDGTTFKGTSIHTSTATRANGTFQFLNVPTGTYRLTTGAAVGFQGTTVTLGGVHGAAGAGFVTGVPVAPGKNLTASISIRGLGPQFISLAQFLSSTSSTSFPAGLPGPGFAAATGPFVNKAIANVTLTNGGTTKVIDLAANFTAPDVTISKVRLDTALGPINLELFDKQAPQTVQNFIDYIQSGKYANDIFHRRTSLSKDGLAVLQGGGFTFTAGSPATLPSVTTFPQIADEVGAPNTPGTIAMAKTGSPNSADSQFFFNLADNTNVLSPKNQANGGFTVFGKIADAASQKVVNELAAFPIHNESTFNGAMSTLPLKGSFTDNDPNFPGTTTPDNFALITAAHVVSRNEVLTYTVSSSNTGVVTATLGGGDPERLILTPVQLGTATITVTAKDQFGQTTSTTFKVTVGGANTAPVVNSVTLSSASPNPTDSVTATVVASDAESNPVTLTYVWKVTNAGGTTTVRTTSNTSNLTDTLKPSDLSFTLQPGDQISVTVTPNDGKLNGTAKSASATVNTPPVVNAPTLLPASPSTTDLVTASAVTSDANGDPVSVTYVWKVTDTLGTTTVVRTQSHTSSPTDGSSTDTLDPTDPSFSLTLNPGDQISVTVTPNDGKIDGTAKSASVLVA